jgi:amidophosphoribosyltransferase
MVDEVRHHCGFCVAHTLHDAYRFVRALQHRGREAAGIAAVGDGRIDVIKWSGGVDRFDVTDLHKILYSPNYHTYMAHVRYATRGRKDKILEDAHPHVVGGQVEHRGNHMLIWDCEMAAVHNGQVGREWFREVSPELLTGTCDTEALLHLYRRHGEFSFLRSVPGAYTWALADKRKRDVVAMRDRTGIKPGVLGWKDGKYGVASEDIAFRKNGGEYLEDLEPGTAYYLTPEGDYSKQKVVEAEPAFCFFEWNYIADVDSILNLASVRRLRESLGEALAEEFRPEGADLVTFLPRCPEVAARAYARRAGLPFVPVFYKMRGERAFQGTTATDRMRSIGENLHLLPGIREVVEGRTVVLLDDSIVRGNNSRRARELLHEGAGAARVFLVSYTPPIGVIGEDGVPRGCLFGVDMPPEPPPGDEFIARGRTPEQVGTEMGMSVVFLSRAGMLRAFRRVGVADRDLCTFCIGGRHPFADGAASGAQMAAAAQLSLLETGR